MKDAEDAEDTEDTNAFQITSPDSAVLPDLLEHLDSSAYSKRTVESIPLLRPQEIRSTSSSTEPWVSCRAAAR